MGAKADESEWQIGPDPGSLVLYKTGKTSVNSEARGGKANLERQKIQDVEIAQNHSVSCQRLTIHLHLVQKGTSNCF